MEGRRKRGSDLSAGSSPVRAGPPAPRAQREPGPRRADGTGPSARRRPDRGALQRRQKPARSRVPLSDPGERPSALLLGNRGGARSREIPHRARLHTRLRGPRLRTRGPDVFPRLEERLPAALGPGPALVRMLGARDRAGYQKSFGGFLYCFLRGMRAPGSGIEGIHAERPDWKTIAAWEGELLRPDFLPVETEAAG